MFPLPIEPVGSYYLSTPESRLPLPTDVERMDHRINDDGAAVDIGSFGWKILEFFDLVLDGRAVHFSEAGFPKLDAILKKRVLNFILSAVN